jgi:2-phosphoglycerate kinase
LNASKETQIEKIKQNLLQQSHRPGPETDAIAASAQQEYELNMKGAKSAFHNFIYEYDTTGKTQSDIANDLARMMRIRFKSNAPRRPPRIILLGPPGSGRSTQATAIAKKFGLVHLCTRTILKNEISKNSHVSKIIQLCIDEGRMVPDQQVLPLIEARIK